MKKILLLMGVVAATFSSCSRDVVQEVNRGRAIEFNSSTNTRATEINSADDLNNFVVTAYDDKGATYFKDVVFGRVNNIYTSTPTYYWPSSGELDFYAYGPKTNQASYNPTDKTLAYTPEASVGAQIDLLAAADKGSNEDSSVNLYFDHILSQIEVSAKIANTSPYTYRIKGVRLGNVVSSGTYDYKDNSWKLGTTPTNYTIEYTTPIELEHYDPDVTPVAPISLMGTEGNAMVIPQNTAAWDKNSTETNDGRYIAVLVNIETTADKTPVYPTTDEDYAWVAIPISTDWEPNVKYSYTIDFTNGAGWGAPDGDDAGEPILNGNAVFCTAKMDEWEPKSTSDSEASATMNGYWVATSFIEYHNVPIYDPNAESQAGTVAGQGKNQSLHPYLSSDAIVAMSADELNDLGIYGGEEAIDTADFWGAFKSFTVTHASQITSTDGSGMIFFVETDNVDGYLYVYINYFAGGGNFTDNNNTKWYWRRHRMVKLDAEEAIMHTIRNENMNPIDGEPPYYTLECITYKKYASKEAYEAQQQQQQQQNN